MSIAEKITCDVCGIERGPANHWIMYDNLDPYKVSIKLYPWSPCYIHLGHLCGSGCATKLLSQKIAEWREEAPIVASELDLDTPF